MSVVTIAGLTGVTIGNLTGAALVEVEDSAGASRKATLAQCRTRMFAGGTGFTAADPLVCGALTATATGATISMAPATGTSSSYITGTNTGGSVFLGVESSTGGSILSGSAAYDVVLKTNAAKAILIATSNTLAVTISSAQAVTFAAGITVTANLGLGATNNSIIRETGAGVICLNNAALNDFARLQFGGTTSSFPSIKRSGVQLHFRLADDAGYTGIHAFDLVLDQGSGDSEILTLRSSDVAHGMTSVTDTTSFATFQKAHVADGGLEIRGLTESVYGLILSGYHTTEDTTKSVSANASVIIRGRLKSGSDIGAMGANANIVAFHANNQTRQILDSDGDSHQDVGTAWTNFDAHNDVALLNLMAAHVTRRNDPLRRNFGQWLGKNRADLEQLKLVTFNDDGHHFVNMSRLTMLHTGAIRQIGGRQQQLEAALRKVIDGNPQIVGREEVLALLN